MWWLPMTLALPGRALRYLAARYGAGTFWTDDPVQRSKADRSASP